MLNLAALVMGLLSAVSVPPAAIAEADVNGILGVSVGMRVSDARARLSALGATDGRATRDGGTKEVWRLERTGFAWIALRAGADGRIVWITGRRRPGAEIRFEDLSRERPSTDTGSVAIWYAPGTSGGVRVTARGGQRRAQDITHIADP